MLLGRADPAAAKRVLADQVEAAQRAVVECMKARGFDYVALPANALFAPGPQMTMSRVEFATEFGLGFLPLSGPNAPAPSALGDDPNASIVAALSIQAQNEWSNAADECVVEADRSTSLLGITTRGWQVIEDFESRVKADPRMTAAAKEWSACMTERGQLFITPWAMRQQIPGCVRGTDRGVHGRQARTDTASTTMH